MTIILILAALIAAALAAGWLADRRMAQMVQREVDDMQRAAAEADAAGAPAAPFAHAELAGLPEPVQRYLKRAIPEGAPRIRAVYLTQKGHIRPAPNLPWLPMSAKQWFTTARPGFVWHVHTRLLPLLWVAGRDKYVRGEGEMLMKPLSLVTMVRARGPEMDMGSFMRYIAEMAWFPTALLPRPGLRWEAIDERSARLLVTDSGQTLAIVYHFAADGDVDYVEGTRYLGSGPDARLEKWMGRHHGCRDFQGMRIPADAEVWWALDSGDFAYFRGTIESLAFDFYPA